MLVFSISMSAQSARFYPTHQDVDGTEGPTEDHNDFYVEVNGNECNTWIVVDGQYTFPRTFKRIPSDDDKHVFRWVNPSTGTVECIFINNDFSGMYNTKVYGYNVGYIIRYYKRRQ